MSKCPLYFSTFGNVAILQSFLQGHLGFTVCHPSCKRPEASRFSQACENLASPHLQTGGTREFPRGNSAVRTWDTLAIGGNGHTSASCATSKTPKSESSFLRLPGLLHGSSACKQRREFRRKGLASLDQEWAVCACLLGAIKAPCADRQGRDSTVVIAGDGDLFCRFPFEQHHAASLISTDKGTCCPCLVF